LSLYSQNEQKGVTVMEKINMFIRCFVLIMLIVSFVACASVPKMETKNEYIGERGNNYPFPNGEGWEWPGLTRILSF
jgi:competence protein ComGC